MRPQDHGAAEQGARRTRSVPHHVAYVASQSCYLAALARVTLNIWRAGQPVRDALRQQNQIAIVQFLPSFRFGMDPARTLADKVKAKQLLLRKGDAPWMSEFAASIIDATQAKVLQDFA